MNQLTKNIHWLAHASFRIEADDLTVYIDPWQLKDDAPPADLILITHDHQDHCSPPDVAKIQTEDTVVVTIAAAAAKGSTRFNGIGELRVKESDRIAAMAAGLRELGIRVEESDDGAVVRGGAFSGAEIESFGDHRIAMSFAVAGTVAEEPVKVCNVAAVETSFPGFEACLQGIGADIRRMPEEAS